MNWIRNWMNCPLNVEPNLYSKSSVKMNTTEYVKSNKKKWGNRLQSILLIKFNKLELSSN